MLFVIQRAPVFSAVLDNRVIRLESACVETCPAVHLDGVVTQRMNVCIAEQLGAYIYHAMGYVAVYHAALGLQHATHLL